MEGDEPQVVPLSAENELDLDNRSSPNNLSNFISNSEILLISDFEGTTPVKHFNKFAEYCTNTNKDENKKVIFLGDVFDNTAQVSDNICDKDVCTDPEDLDNNDCVDESNYCALKTIKLLVDNPENCRYIIGNRDLNKIKLLPFFSFSSGEKWWTHGNSYHEIVKNLLKSLEKNKDPWLITGDNLKYFRPFWNNKNDKYEKRWINNILPYYDITERFKRIFGADPSVGTMSALVTLKCIPNEICSHMSEYENHFLGFLEKFEHFHYVSKLKKHWRNKKEEHIEYIIKIRVALTITIFMRMLDKPEGNIVVSPTTDIRTELWKFNTLDGYLYHYLSEAKPAYYAINQNNLFLFAHGGITDKFIEKEGLAGINQVTLTEDQWDNILDYSQQTRGGGENSAYAIAIDNYNTNYKAFLDSFFASVDFEVIKYSMLSLLKLSAGNKKDETEYYPNQVKQPSDQVLDKFYLAAKNKTGNIYNIFGHASASSCYSFGKAREKDKESQTRNEFPELTRKKDNMIVSADSRTYFINTDYSTTLFKEGIKCDKNNKEIYNNNYLILILDTRKNISFKCSGTISLNKDKFVYTQKNIHEIGEADKELSKDTSGKLIAPEKIDPFIFDSDVNLIDVIDTIDANNKNSNFMFNGIIKTNEELQYEVFSTIFSRKYNPSMALIRHNPLSGGRKRRTRKHRITKRPKQIKKKKGVRRTKKHARKTRRKAHY